MNVKIKKPVPRLPADVHSLLDDALLNSWDHVTSALSWIRCVPEHFHAKFSFARRKKNRRQHRLIILDKDKTLRVVNDGGEEGWGPALERVAA